MTLPLSPTLTINFLNSGFIWSLSEDSFLIGSDITPSHNSSSIYPSANNGCLYAPDFYLNCSTPFYHPKSTAIFSRRMLIEELKELENLTSCGFSPLKWSGVNIDIFREDFLSIKEMISKGDVEKIVISGFDLASQRINIEHLRQLILRLLHTYKEDHYIYGLWNKESGLLGATPEMLFEIDAKENIIHSVALAGTRCSHHGASILTEDKKESHEHDLVILGIRKALAPLQVMLGSTTELILRNSSHLHTTITCRSDKPWNIFDLINKMHPTPALGAYPRSAGLEWLKSHNHFGGGFPKVGRSRFGAPIAWIKGEDTADLSLPERCLVGIRNIQWQDEEVAIGAGCGIVKQSIFEREFSELQNKIASVKEWVI